MRRKILAVIVLICIILIQYVPTAYADDSAYTFVRVKLSMGTPSSIAVNIDGNYSIEGSEEIALSRDNYTVKLISGKIKLYLGGSLVYTGSSLTLVQHAATEGRNNYITLNNSKYGNTSYLGDMRFAADSSCSYIVVINKLYIEDYLYGVLPYEMSDSWPIEALKAQAVCARNYVENHINGGSYDVVDTSANQVYRGYRASAVNSIKAVNDTAGIVITSGGILSEVYFAASNGGYTDIPQHVWSAPVSLQPYHIIQEDVYDAANAFSPQEALIFPKAITRDSTISYQYSQDGKMTAGTGNESSNVEKYLLIRALPAVAAKGYTAIQAADIKILGINSITPNTYEGQHNAKDYSGNNACVFYQNATVNMTVLTKRFVPSKTLGDVNSDGNVTISDYTLVRLGILSLKQLNDIEKAAADVNIDGQISVSDYTILRLALLGLKSILSINDGIWVEDSVTVEFDINMHEFDKNGGEYQAFSNLSLRLFVVTQTDADWRIYHRRYGHGVGLSQRGAEQRAKSADGNVNTFDKIIAFYYPNTVLSMQSYSRPVLTPLIASSP